MQELDSIKPAEQIQDAITPKGTPNTKTPEAPKDPPPCPKVQPAPKTKKQTEHCKPDQTPRWKIALEFGAVFVGILVAIIYGMQLGQMVDANKLTQNALQISQRANVTLGRKDGVLADFVIPKDPKQEAEIVVYFQNSGHIPAKFAWGTMAALRGGGSKKNSGITYTHPYTGLDFRTRDKKSGSMGEQGESSVIQGDSVLVSTLGTISQADLASLPVNNPSLLIVVNYDYCDAFGDFEKHQFVLHYRSNAPIPSLSFYMSNDMVFTFEPPPPTATTEYLPPCETIDEKERKQEQMHKEIEKSWKPWYRRMF